MILSILLWLCFIVMMSGLVWALLMSYDILRASTFNYVAVCFIMVCSMSGAITLDLNGIGPTPKETKEKVYRSTGYTCNVAVIKEKRSWAQIDGDFTKIVYAVTLSDGSSYMLGEKEWNKLYEGDHIPEGMCNNNTQIKNLPN